MATLKGQNFRICIYDSAATKYKVIGMATNCTVTLTNNTDDASHKDIVGAAAMPTTISKSWQVSCDSLNVADAAAMLTAIKSMQPMTLMWDETATSDNQTRAKATFARKGSAYLNDVTFNFNDRENSSKSLQFSGSGELETLSTTPSVEAIAAGAFAYALMQLDKGVGIIHVGRGFSYMQDLQLALICGKLELLRLVTVRQIAHQKHQLRTASVTKHFGMQTIASAHGKTAGGDQAADVLCLLLVFGGVQKRHKDVRG